MRDEKYHALRTWLLESAYQDLRKGADIDENCLPRDLNHFSLIEILQNAEYLHMKGLATYTPDETAEETIGLELRITKKGMDCVEKYEASVEDYLNRKRSSKANVTIRHVNGGSFSFGDKNTVISHTTNVMNAVQQLGKDLRKLRDLDQVIVLSDDEISLLENPTDISKVKAVLSKLASMVASEAVSGVVRSLGEKASELLPLV